MTDEVCVVGDSQCSRLAYFSTVYTQYNNSVAYNTTTTKVASHIKHFIHYKMIKSSNNLTSAVPYILEDTVFFCLIKTLGAIFWKQFIHKYKTRNKHKF